MLSSAGLNGIHDDNVVVMAILREVWHLVTSLMSLEGTSYITLLRAR